MTDGGRIGRLPASLERSRAETLIATAPFPLTPGGRCCELRNKLATEGTMLGPLVLAHSLLHFLAQTPSPSASSTSVADAGPVFSSLWVDLTAAAGFGAVGGV